MKFRISSILLAASAAIQPLIASASEVIGDLSSVPLNEPSAQPMQFTVVSQNGINWDSSFVIKGAIIGILIAQLVFLVILEILKRRKRLSSQ